MLSGLKSCAIDKHANGNRPSVLIGVVTRNRSELLTRCLTSARNQLNCNISISVIDDGSTDCTPSVASQFPEVAWTRRDKPSGYLVARNEFMSKSGFKYFVSLDDDAWFVAGDEVQTAVDYMEAHSDVGVVAFDLLTPDRPERKKRTLPRETAVFVGCGHMLRLASAQSLGLYLPTPGSYGGEEKDLALRMVDAGHKIALLPGVHVWHEITPIERDVPSRYRSVVSNDLAITFRRVPSYLLPAALCEKLLRHGLFSFRRGIVPAYLEGVSCFFRSIGGLWSSRKPVAARTLWKFVKLSRQS
jgi:glycosyltransferase involved in cell wall biosynthesis